MGNKSAARHFLISVTGPGGINFGMFAKKTGGNPKSDVSRVWDGGEDVPDILTSPPTYDDLTVGRPFEVARDVPMLQKARPLVGGDETWGVRVQPTNARFEALSAATDYSCRLIGTTDPDADASSGDATSCELMFAVRSAK